MRYPAFLIILLFPLLAGASESKSWFTRGVNAYENGDPAVASDAFRKALDLRPSSGTLQNLGNACWQQGRPGDAVLAWEQALWLNPFDRNARNNLEFGRERAQLESPRLTWYEAASAWLPVNWWAWIAAFSLWSAIAALVLPSALRKPRASWHQAVAALSLGILLLTLPAHLGTLTRSRIGFVLAKEAAVRLTPTADGERVTRLAPGDPVRVGKWRGAYRFVRTPAGSGWMHRDEIGTISGH